MIAVDVFEPIDHESVVQMVVDKIETMIVDGVLKGGASLPSEREMADAFHVSRPKLREALQVLESRNLVTVRHGDGTYIAELTGQALRYDARLVRPDVDGPVVLELADHGQVVDDRSADIDRRPV